MATKLSRTSSPVEATLSFMSDKWKVLILRDLLTGTKRFGELKKSIGSISQKVLTSNLRAMEEDGLLSVKCSPKCRRASNIRSPIAAAASSPSSTPCASGARHTWPNSLLKKKPPTSRTKLRTFQRFDERPVALLQFVVRQIALERFERHERAPQQACRGIERQLCMVAI